MLGAALWVLVAIIVIVALWRPSSESPEPMADWPPVVIDRLPLPDEQPDFGSIRDVKTKKRAFFDYLLPMVRNANAAVMEERLALLPLIDLARKNALSVTQREQLQTLADRYGVDLTDAGDDAALTELKRRIDVVPASLILAQAANESAWGTSRFAVSARNFFGIWCFDPGCGLTPRLRDDDLTHEVRLFATVADGVGYYLHTINTHRAYTELRQTRETLRLSGKTIRGNALAEGLIRYSERGGEYVDEIQAMIRVNRLHEYTLDYAALLPED